MEIPKDEILQLLRDRGDHAKADQAAKQLPDRVDPEHHTELLGKLGINAREMMEDIIGRKLGL